jgi:diphthamide biosynthesis protein 3
MADDEEISIYDEVEIEDMTYDETLQIYHYPCPCGDRFEIALCDLQDGQDIGVCPSCSLMIRVIFDAVGSRDMEGGAGGRFYGHTREEGG